MVNNNLTARLTDHENCHGRYMDLNADYIYVTIGQMWTLYKLYSQINRLSLKYNTILYLV